MGADETEELRRALERAEGLIRFGRMAAALGHEINNPITSALLAVGVLDNELKACSDDEALRRRLHQSLEDLRASLAHVSLLVEDARGYSDADRPTTEVDLREVARRALRLMRIQIGDAATIIERLEPVPPITAHRHRLVQVGVNLLSNALSAIQRDASRPHTIEVATREANGRAELVVQDDGPGIAEDLHEVVFAPLVSRRGAGTGLGLWLSREIVIDYGGSLSLACPPEGGCRFVMALPLLTNDDSARG